MILRSLVVSRKRDRAWAVLMCAVGVIKRNGVGAGPFRGWFASKDQLRIRIRELWPAIQAVLSVSAGR